MRELLKLIKANPDEQDDIIIRHVMESDWFEENYKNSAVAGVQATIIEELTQSLIEAEKLLREALNDKIDYITRQNIEVWLKK